MGLVGFVGSTKPLMLKNPMRPARTAKCKGSSAAHQTTSIRLDGAAGQDWNPANYEEHASFVPNLLGRDLITEALNPKPHERVLDLACGDGALAPRLSSQCANLVGFDASKELIAVARERHSSVAKFLLMDAQAMDSGKLLEINDGNYYDAVFSNASIHWMKKNPAAVLHGVASVLKRGGRFVAECGGRGNVDSVRRALHASLVDRGVSLSAIEAADPWVFHAPEEYSALLESAGFRVEGISLRSKPVEVSPGGLRGWILTFAGCFLELVPVDQRDEVVEDVALKVEALQARGTSHIDYVRLRFVAFK